jgi:putative two-component system response regulator
MNNPERFLQNHSEDFPMGNDASFFDSLTGLHNHSMLHLFLDQEIKRAKRYNKPFAVAIVDVDDFSLFNETHSYSQGDVVLKTIAGCIKSTIREVDIPTRFLGDQFVVLITEIDKSNARFIAERIRQQVHVSTGCQVTVSIGLVSFPVDARDRSNLIAKARHALRRAKLSGKNQVYQLDEKEPISAHVDKIRVLIVDDDPRNLKLLDALFDQNTFLTVRSQSGTDALNSLEKYDIDVVLLDVIMPDMDGYEVCRRIKTNEFYRFLPVIMLTAIDEREQKIRGIEAGADDFIIKPPNRLELLARVNSLARLKVLNKNLTDIKKVLLSLAKAVEAKDHYTLGHVERVANLATSIGRRMDLSRQEIEALWFAGVLHDIGKVGIPDQILNKSGPLDSDEWQIMKTHADLGYQICLPLQSNLGAALKAIRHHHEKLDGTGYPDGLTENAIPLLARIIAVVDIYDALTTTRSYRPGMPPEKALRIVEGEVTAGKLDAMVFSHLQELIT